MPVVINYKICDLAPECGGIEVCPVKAFFWNPKTKRPEVDNQKCTTCGLCTPECPVKAILVAQTDEELRQLKRDIKNDPRSEKELWRERLGCQPGRTPSSATIVTPKNFDQEILKAQGLVALDIWSEETLDCRYHSVLWEDLVPGKKLILKKLDGGRYPQLAKRLKVTKLPSLLFLEKGKEAGRKEGYLYASDKEELRKQIKSLNSN